MLTLFQVSCTSPYVTHYCSKSSSVLLLLRVFIILFSNYICLVCHYVYGSNLCEYPCVIVLNAN